MGAYFREEALVGLHGATGSCVKCRDGGLKPQLPV